MSGLSVDKGGGPSRSRVASELFRTLQRWKEADYRLVIGIAVVLTIVAFRLGAIGLDTTEMSIYDPPSTSGRFSSAVQGAAFCTDAPGYLLGVDRDGRPLAQTLVESSEVFFTPGLLCCAIALLLGTLLGAVSGYYRGGFLERGIKLGLTIVAAYPRLIIVIVAIGVFKMSLEDPGRHPGLRLAMIAVILGLAYVPVLALAIYQKVSAFQREEFVEAARAHGLSHGRILGYHILWANCTPVMARHFFYLFGYFVLVETSLSWLGYGPAMPSWGKLIEGCGGGSLVSIQFLAPVVCTVITILGLQL
ncbi:MAG: ABC transporter permease subunit, partial [Myxococcota bacterium]|nr:ABC transporter permease subunit [Myxococcota bacterium]